MRAIPFLCSIVSVLLAGSGSLASSRLEVRVEGVPASRPFAQQLVEQSQRVYEEARPWFEVELESPVTVEWVTDDAVLRRRGGEPGTVAGLANPGENRIVLVASALTRPDRVRGVLLHEFCHLLFARATERAAVEPPRWLNEGTAMWRSGEWDLGLEWRGNRANLLADALAAGTVLPLETLDASFPRGPFFRVAYAQSLSFVQWLVQRGGEGEFRRFLRRLDDDLDPEPAFAEVYGLSLAEAESKWLRSLGKRGWLAFLPSAGTLFTGLWAVLGVLVVVKFVRTRLRLRAAGDGLEEGEG